MITEKAVPDDVKRLRIVGYATLSLVAAVGAVLSYDSLQHRAEPIFHRLSYGFPLLVDALIVGASLVYIAGSKMDRARTGWRVMAHAGVAGTITLNALAATNIAGIPWHIAAPAVWSALVEMVAAEMRGDARATNGRPDRIPLRLWINAPIESWLTTLRVQRRSAHAGARMDVGADAAALAALKLALPGWRARKVRRILRRQLRAGSLTPAAVLARSVTLMEAVPETSPRGVLRDVLRTALPVTVETIAPEEPRTEVPVPIEKATSPRVITQGEVTGGPGITKEEAAALAPADLTPGWYRDLQAQHGGSDGWWKDRKNGVRAIIDATRGNVVELRPSRDAAAGGIQ